jgi:hypothetical protein
MARWRLNNRTPPQAAHVHPDGIPRRNVVDAAALPSTIAVFAAGPATSLPFLAAFAAYNAQRQVRARP